jgi:hypothetical protein
MYCFEGLLQFGRAFPVAWTSFMEAYGEIVCNFLSKRYEILFPFLVIKFMDPELADPH